MLVCCVGVIGSLFSGTVALGLSVEGNSSDASSPVFLYFDENGPNLSLCCRDFHMMYVLHIELSVETKNGEYITNCTDLAKEAKTPGHNITAEATAYAFFRYIGFGMPFS